MIVKWLVFSAGASGEPILVAEFCKCSGTPILVADVCQRRPASSELRLLVDAHAGISLELLALLVMQIFAGFLVPEFANIIR